MFNLNQKGVIAPIILLILLAAGIFAGVWLITNGDPLKLFSKAGGGYVEFLGSDQDQKSCIKIQDGRRVIICPTVKFKITVPTTIEGEQ